MALRICVISLLLCATLTSTKAFFEPCIENDPYSELRFLDPYMNSSHPDYPSQFFHVYLNPGFPKQIDAACCAQGFSHIDWYFEDKKLDSSPSSDALYSYDNATLRQNLRLISDIAEPGIWNLTCVAYSANSSNDFIDNRAVIHVQERQRPAPFASEVVEIPKNKCAVIGGTLELSCKMKVLSQHPVFFQNIILERDDGSELNHGPLHNVNVTVLRGTDDCPTCLSVSFYVSNVTEEYLDRNFTCFIYGYQQTRTTFTVKSGCPTEEPPVTVPGPKEDRSKEIAGIVAGVMVVLIVVLILVVRFNMEAKMWCNVNIVQRLPCCMPGSSAHDTDIYMIYSDVDHPLISQTINSLENENKLRLCIPDRDFEVGAVTPDSLSNGIKSSTRVVAFLSNEMFRKSEQRSDWSDVSLSLALSLNKPLLIVLLENLEKQSLSKRRNLKAALKIVDVVAPTDDNLRSKLRRFLAIRKTSADETIQMA